MDVTGKSSSVYFPKESCSSGAERVAITRRHIYRKESLSNTLCEQVKQCEVRVVMSASKTLCVCTSLPYFCNNYYECIRDFMPAEVSEF